MTFLNAILLGGLATAAIPVIIHLLHRRRYRVVAWGAMDFLEEVFRTQRRRVRLEEWLLLALRCALLALLAFLMARPVLTGGRAPLGSTPTSMIVLLDNSLSMEAGDEVRSNFSAAAAETVELLLNLPRGSEATVLGLAGPLPTPPEPTHDVEGVARAISAATGGYGGPDIPARLEMAAGLLASARHPDRELVVVSDFQRSNWSPRESEARARAIARLNAQPLPVRRVLLMPARDIRENVSVAPLEVPRSVVGVNRPLRIRALIRNHGAQAQSGLRARLRVNGEERAVSEISLGPHESGTLLFTHRFDRPGSQAIEVEVEADRLRADNVGRASVEVFDRLPVLLIAGRASTEPLRGEADFLERALRPRPAIPSASDEHGVIEPTVVTEDAFSPDSLAKMKAVVLANVSRLKEEQTRAIERFVRDGGGLLVLPGDRARADWYNERLFSNGDGCLPAAMVEIITSAEATPASILSGRFDHPALALFNDPRSGGLRGAQIWTWHRLAAAPSADKVAGETAVMAKINNGDALLMEQRWGAGSVILAALPANTAWSNLPLRPFFVPLMQEMVIWLASTVHPPRNVFTGGRLAAVLPSGMDGHQVRFTTPEGAVIERPVETSGDRALAVLEPVSRPGIYSLEMPEGERMYFTAAPPPDESELGALEEDEWQALADELDAKTVRSSGEYLSLDRQRRYGRELWPYLLALVMGLCVAEIGLANRCRGGGAS